jgi:hypothetical protein
MMIRRRVQLSSEQLTVFWEHVSRCRRCSSSVTCMQDLCAKLVKSGTSTPPQRMDRECGGVEEEVPFTSTSNKQPGTEPVNSSCASSSRMEEEGQGRRGSSRRSKPTSVGACNIEQKGQPPALNPAAAGISIGAGKMHRGMGKLKFHDNQIQ